MAFEDIAPIISGLGVTEEQVNAYFENKIQPPAPPVIPEITKPKVVTIATALYITGIENAGGVVKLAQMTKLRTSQVKMIIREIKALESVWSAAQQEEEIPEEPEE